jgi:hypothetical protein
MTTCAVDSKAGFALNRYGSAQGFHDCGVVARLGLARAAPSFADGRMRPRQRSDRGSRILNATSYEAPAR